MADGDQTLISGSPGSANNDGAHCASRNLELPVDLSITKTNNRTVYIRGASTVYTIVVSNAGPFGVQNGKVNDTLPAGVATASWTCGNPVNGAVCGAVSGVGGINNAVVDLPPNSSLTFQLTLTVPAGQSGNFANIATVTSPDGSTDNNQANNTATDTDTPQTAALTLAKAWAPGSIANNIVTIGASTGGINNTVAFNATAPNAANSGAAVAVGVGDVITLPAETGTDVGNYTTALNCSGGHTLSGTNGQQANTLTITGTNPVVCTYTNTPRTTTLQLAKAWAAGSIANHQVTIGATTGGTNNTASFNATAPNAANSGPPVTVTIGNVVTLPAETGANVANYTTTVACTGGHTLSGSNGQQANTLTFTSVNPALCTYTNTLIQADLSVTKTNNAATVLRGSQTSYTITVRNSGPAAANGAVVHDTPVSNLNNCSVTACTPAGSCPASPGDLLTAGGATLGALAANNSVVFTVQCTVAN